MVLVSISDVKAFIRNDEYTDGQIQAVIDRVSGVISEALGHLPGTPVTVTRYFNGNGTKELLLYDSPANSLSSVSYYDGLTWTDYDVSNIDIVDGRRVVLRYSPSHPYQYFPEGINNIRITYTFGYETVPSWVKDYALLKIADELMPGDYTEALKRAEEAFVNANKI